MESHTSIPLHFGITFRRREWLQKSRRTTSWSVHLASGRLPLTRASARRVRKRSRILISNASDHGPLLETRRPEGLRETRPGMSRTLILYAPRWGKPLDVTMDAVLNPEERLKWRHCLYRVLLERELSVCSLAMPEFEASIRCLCSISRIFSVHTGSGYLLAFRESQLPLFDKRTTRYGFSRVSRIGCRSSMTDVRNSIEGEIPRNFRWIFSLPDSQDGSSFEIVNDPASWRWSSLFLKTVKVNDRWRKVLNTRKLELFISTRIVGGPCVFFLYAGKFFKGTSR